VQEEIVAQADWRSQAPPPPSAAAESVNDRLSHIQTELTAMASRIGAISSAPPANQEQAMAGALEASLERHTVSLLEAVAGVKAAVVVSGTAAVQPVLDALERAKIADNLENLGKSITLLSVKLDKSTAAAASGGAGSKTGGGGGVAVKREAETTTSPAVAGEVTTDQLSLALAELGKDLRSQLDDVHDMVANVEENTSRVLADVRTEMKVPVSIEIH
jgi:hypothetical protein